MNLITNSLITLGLEESEGKGKGRYFQSKFIEPGIAHYDELGDILITKETLDKFINTMVGCPVIINHKDVNDKNVDKLRVGTISRVWFNEVDGWYYCEGILTDPQAIDLVKNQGWNVSCSYNFVGDGLKKTYHGKEIDQEFTDGEFLHLAIVENPRYENANIVVNSKDNTEEKENILMAAMDDLKMFILSVVNNACKNETPEEEEKKDEVKNEEVDKRDIIRQIMAIAGKEEASEDVKTIAKLAEKLAYDKDEADNEADEEEKEKEEKPADNKCKNEADDKKEEEKTDNEDEEKEEDVEEKEEVIKNEEEDKKEEVKNSMDDMKRIIMGGSSSIKEDSLYTSQAERLELGNEY